MPDSGGKKDLVAGATARAEAVFKDAWARKYPGVQHVEYSYGRDRALLKKLVTQLGEDGLAQLIADYFEAFDHDARVSRDGYPTVPKLFYHAQYLLLRRARQEQRRLHPRTAANIEEARKAMGK